MLTEKSKLFPSEKELKAEREIMLQQAIENVVWIKYLLEKELDPEEQKILEKLKGEYRNEGI